MSEIERLFSHETKLKQFDRVFIYRNCKLKVNMAVYSAGTVFPMVKIDLNKNKIFFFNSIGPNESYEEYELHYTIGRKVREVRRKNGLTQIIG